MKDRLLLLLYLVLVVAATLIHDVRLLGAGLVLVHVTAWPPGSPLLWRVARAALPFILAVNIGYLVLEGWNLHELERILAPLNLRLLLLVSLAFRMLPAVDLQRALGFSRTLRFVLILATSQVLAFRRLFTDFQQALGARTTRRPGLRTSLRQGAALGAFFLRRAEHDATEITQALTARGFFLDRD